MATKRAFNGPMVMSMSSTEVDDGRGPDDPSRLDDTTLLFWCQTVDVNFTVDVLLAKTVKFRCDDSLDVIFGVLTEVVFVEVQKFDGLLDEVLLKLLFFHVDVGGYLKHATAHGDVNRGSDQEVLEVHIVLSCWSVYCLRCKVLELLVPLEVVLEVEVLVVVLLVVFTISGRVALEVVVLEVVQLLEDDVVRLG